MTPDSYVTQVGRFFRVDVPSVDMDEYTVTGRWNARDGWQSFEKALEAENEDVAVEHVYAEFGSRHGLKRTQVEIAEVSA